jgi:CRP-like cAMP-binding protein
MLTTIEKVLLLQNIELFSNVTSEQLAFLAVIAEEVVMEPARVLYRQGDPPDGLYVVVSGSVRMERSGEEIDRIGINRAFGVWALFDDAPRLTTAETAEETRLLFVGRNDFYDVLSDHVDIVEGLFKQFVLKLRQIATVIEQQ